MKYSLLLFFVFSLGLLCKSFGQIPIVSPSQTVNTGTGEMAFSLPLGTVKGVAGHDFPVNLNYQAGIRLQQASSPAGLGFSYGAGSIVRKQVFVPDDNQSGFYQETRTSSNSACGPTPDFQMTLDIISAIFIVLSIVLMALTSGASTPLTILGSLAANVALSGVQLLIVFAISGADFSAGGLHTPQYDFSVGKGIGFFKGGNATDLPDVYFVNTPYVSGEILWQGDPQTGHFFLNQTGGNSTNGKQAIQIQYNCSNVDDEEWVITLADGTRLFFGSAAANAVQMQKSRARYQSAKLAGNDDQYRCIFYTTIEQLRKIPSQWFLHSVLFPGYVDGSTPKDLDPLNSNADNKGAWFVFKYLKIEQDAFQTPSYFKASQFTVGTTYTTLLSDVYLTEVVTPNQSAVYGYRTGRKDDLYFWAINLLSDPEYSIVDRKILTKVQIYNSNDVSNSTVIRNIVFNTDYSLRPSTFTSLVHYYGYDFNNWQYKKLAENPTAGSLTLKSVVVGNGGSTALPVQFFYGKNSPAFSPGAIGWIGYEVNNSIQKYPYSIEKRDYWGYYCPQLSSTNVDLNHDGKKSQAIDADAWSLNKINLPGDLTIEWQYEPNTYSFANGVDVKGEIPVVGGVPQPNDQVEKKYGGGIRVKNMVVNSGIGNVTRYSYQYTANSSLEAETDLLHSSSGVATCEPMPYLVIDQATGYDPRPFKARGDLYTPAKVAYSKVKVVSRALASPTDQPSFYDMAVNGWTEYNMFTALDFPNEGKYGSIDRGWKRGNIKSIVIYPGKARSNGGIPPTSATTFTYGYKPFDAIYNNVYDWHNKSCNAVVGAGWVYLKQTETVENSVKTIKKMNYAFDVTDANPVEVTSITTNQYRQYELDSRGGIQDGSCYFTRSVGDIQKLDILLARRPTFNRNVEIRLCIDLDAYNQNQFVVNWSKPFDLTGTSGITGTNVSISRMGFIAYDNDAIINDVCIIYSADQITKTLVMKDINIGSDGTLDFQTVQQPSINITDIPVYGTQPMVSDVVNWGGLSTCHGTALLSTQNASDRIWVVTDQGKSTLVAIERIPNVQSGDYDGMANQLIETNSGGESKVTVPIHAYVKYPAMDIDNNNTPLNTTDDVTNHMLTQTTQNIIYGVQPNVPITSSVNSSSITIASDGTEHNLSLNLEHLNQLFEGVKIALEFKAKSNSLLTMPIITYALKLNYLSGAAKSTPQNTLIANYFVDAIGKTDYFIAGSDLVETISSIDLVVKAIDNSVSLRDITCSIWPEYKLSDNKVLASTATAWANNSGTWQTNASYVWKGVPSSKSTSQSTIGTITMPVFPSAVVPVDWQFTGATTKVNKFFQPTEFVKPGINGSLYSTVVFDRTSVIPLATITNARFGECIFTSFEDYKIVVPDNCSSNSSLVTGSDVFAGKKCIRVVSGSDDQYACTDWAPVNSELSPLAGKKIIIEFRAKTNTSTLTILGTTSAPALVQLQSNISPNTLYDSPQFAVTTQWQKYSYVITIPTSEAAKGYRVVLRPVNMAGASYNSPGDIFYDEVRAYPQPAFMTSYTYDPVSSQPTSVTDANMNTSWTTFDNFGRPIIGYNTKKEPFVKHEYSIRKSVLSVSAPAGFRGSANSSTMQTVQWDNIGNENLESCYIIERSDYLNGPFVPIKTLFNPSRKYSEAFLSPGGVATYFRMYSKVGDIKSPITNTVTITRPSLLQADVGNPGSIGDFTFTGSYVIQGGGADIGGSSDQFHFVYSSMAWVNNAVFGLSAMVAGIDETNVLAKAGIMFRENIEAGSKFFMIVFRPDGKMFVEYRSATNGSAASTEIASAGRFIKAEKDQGFFKIYNSADGVSWKWVYTINEDFLTGSNLLVGLSVTAHDNTKLCTASFENVNFDD